MAAVKIPAIKITVLRDDFNAGVELRRLHSGDAKVGAVCSFIGYVRDFGDDPNILGIEVEHYPGMTESALQDIAAAAGKRWSLQGVVILHRVGYLKAAEQIVMVACASAHRKAAFSASEYIMDFLKARAPFWKKEISAERSAWVEAKTSDEESAEYWRTQAKTAR